MAAGPETALYDRRRPGPLITLRPSLAPRCADRKTGICEQIDEPCGGWRVWKSPSPIIDPMRTAPGIRSNRPRAAPKFPMTVRPTEADIAVARAIARDTGPAPEKLARVLTWGADEKVLLILRGGRLARLARPGQAAAVRGQPRRAGGGRRVNSAARDEASVRPNPSGPQDGAGPRSRHLLLRQARGCLSFRPRAAHGRAGVRRWNVAGRAPPGDQGARGRAFADPRRGSGPLSERCRRRVCDRSHLERTLRLWTGYPSILRRRNHADF